MRLNPGQDGKRTTLATAGLLLALLCCALPLLLTAGALGAAGAVLGSPWLIGSAVAILLGLIAWRLRRSSAKRSPSDPHER